MNKHNVVSALSLLEDRITSLEDTVSSSLENLKAKLAKLDKLDVIAEKLDKAITVGAVNRQELERINSEVVELAVLVRGPRRTNGASHDAE